MAAMKVTTSAAMRARDVSRPHAKHLAFAEAAEASAAVDEPAQVDAAGANAVPGDGPGDEVLRDGRGGTRRRWRPRGSGRGRASSR
jgi:hypothetical protein